MNSDKPDNRSFVEQVETYFMSTVQQGLALRSDDVDLIKDWQQRGVPFGVVQKGIADGIRRFLASAEPSQPLPSRLKFYRTSVEAEFKTWTRAAAMGLGITPRPTVPTTDMGALAVEILEKWAIDAEPVVREIFLNGSARIQQNSGKPGLGELLESVDNEIALALLEALPMSSQWKDQLQAVTTDAKRRGMGVRGVEELELATVRAFAKELTGYNGLVDACLGS